MFSYFTTEGGKKDAKAKKFAKKMATFEFVSTLYIMIDALSWIGELCLVFQNRECIMYQWSWLVSALGVLDLR